MATHPSYPLAAISEALNAWQTWDKKWSERKERPDIGEVLGVGSANTVFALKRAPDLVFRVRHNSASLSLNPPKLEIALWRAAAKLGFAPDILWVGANEDVVITRRLAFDELVEQAQSQLLKTVHESGITAPRLSLEETANRYAGTIKEKELGPLALNHRTPAILHDLQRLDNEPGCFCHNDLTPSNIGKLADSHLAIDWEYASLGSRHFDIAVATQTMENDARQAFAKRTAGAFFNLSQWQAACRVAPLMDHLWTLAVFGRAEGAQSKAVVEANWALHE